MRLTISHSGDASTRFAKAARCGFTLIELILVMALLIIVISLTAPRLSSFFHGRTLDSEARRLLALTHSGHSRAVSEGLPMDLWLDPKEGTFGLEAEPGFQTTDTNAVEFTLDSGLQLTVVNRTVASSTPNTINRFQQATIASVPPARLVHANLPTIRFLPDGSVGESSPQMLRLTSSDGGSLYLALSRDAANYEIRNTED